MNDRTTNRSGLRDGVEDRAIWVAMLDQIAAPVLSAMSEGALRQRMPVEARPDVLEERTVGTYLEAVGRLLCGISPWLEHGPEDGQEGGLRTRYSEQARRSLELGCDPSSPEYLRFGQSRQTLVDAAFLGLAILRAPVELWEKLTPHTRSNVIAGLKTTRSLQPNNNNWLLFAAMVEVTLKFAGEPWQKDRVDHALERHEHWYLGDGVYGDGDEFHFDYYNSFVIQPFLLQIMDREADAEPRWAAMRKGIEERATRYAAIQERMIAPDGTYPAVGRSLAYRCGAFHHLAEMSLREQLPQGVAPAQVRSAMTTMMKRSLGAPGTFDSKGWMTIGFCGHQPAIGESYISTGSLYLCSTAFLPLGLGPESRFWSGPGAEWTARKAWSGVDIPADHALQGTDA